MTIGLTGGIGSGKSVVAKLFKMLGCAIFNSDEAARAVYFDNRVKEEVIKLLGKEAYESETRIDKNFIANKVFSDTELLHRLNNIIHPAVKTLFEQFKSEHKSAIIIKETALLFETKINTEVDKIIIVASRDDLRIKRVMERDGLTRTEVENRIKSQLPQEDKIKLSDFVIYNNEEEFLITQVLRIYSKIKELA